MSTSSREFAGQAPALPPVAGSLWSRVPSPASPRSVVVRIDRVTSGGVVMFARLRYRGRRRVYGLAMAEFLDRFRAAPSARSGYDRPVISQKGGNQGGGIDR